MTEKSQAKNFLDNLTAAASRFEGRTLDEIKEDLRSEGVDPDEVLSKFRQLLREHAPTWKERAQSERAAALRAVQPLREKVSRTREKVVSEIRHIVESLKQQGTEIVAGAYYRKFEEATDEDLESLLEDLKVQFEAVRKKRRTTDEKAT